MLNKSLCPLCGKSNQCAVELEKTTGATQATCWCIGVEFNAELLSRLPAQDRGLACICPSCAGQTGIDLRPDTLSG